ncbi:MAG TPA: xanthine dehydrogenase family protein subunit M [Geminicoccus sp.]|jgi:carbon-monoxide dehydrogenase medium subunit|uniref:FAD binding domain-containing protein n=1 Tax=Geminicoccus sp. TaxID=2024832 RepID=UPI002E2F8880|nr:xanthine dehydrogenase family protein subunit M [Geminicoccus sp.]HEX2527719.1 xanthine dehydrogenase family protein subunit M [Geminicoccus sp.]
MYAFGYHRPGSVADAVKLLADNPDAKLLAGGQTFIPTLKQRLAQPSDVIDLGGIPDLQTIRAEGDRLVIGAMVKHAAVAKDSTVRSMIPALAAMAGDIGDVQVRNRGTIGGSVSNNDPAADYPGAVVALGATVTTDRRTIAGEDFFTGMFETALEEGEILTSIAFPKPIAAAYEKFRNPASRYAMVGVFVAKLPSGVRVAVTGAGPCVFRLPDFEAALASNFSASAIENLTVDASGLNSDIHASADYRAHLVKVVAKRALAKAK